MQTQYNLEKYFICRYVSHLYVEKEISKKYNSYTRINLENYETIQLGAIKF